MIKGIDPNDLHLGNTEILDLKGMLRIAERTIEGLRDESDR